MDPDNPQPAKIYMCGGNTGLKAGLAITGGVVSVLFLILVFLVALSIPRKDDSFQPAFVSALSVIPVFLFGYAFYLLRSPVKVVVDGKGIVIHGLISRNEIVWSDVHQLAREKKTLMFGGKQVDELLLLDRDRKELAKLTGVLDNFADLVAEVEQRSAAAQGFETFDRDKEIERRRKRDLTKYFWLRILFGAFTSLFVFATLFGVYDYYHESRLDKGGRQVDAKIVKHYMYNVTPRLEYAFAADDGKDYENDVMVEKRTWESLKQADLVRVRYLAESPEWNRLSTGQEGLHDSGTLIFAGLAGVVMMGGIFLFLMSGYDIVSKNGKISIRKLGDPDDDFELEPTSTLVEVPRSVVVDERPADAVADGQRRPQDSPENPDMPSSGSIPKGILVIIILNAVFLLFGGLIDLGRIGIGIFSVDYFLVVFGLFGLLCDLLLLMSAIGLYLMKNWGRILAVIAGLSWLLLSLAWMTGNIMNFAGLEWPEGADNTATVIGFVGGIILSLLLMVYPIVLVIVMSKRSTREIFRAGQHGR